ncbi:hypothetical protein BGX38DRAFT_1264471 [Terfezia claveryi]|nr:hypothetical protein BGX38DRAFT_1264471 [Terfezia claveryi]
MVTGFRDAGSEEVLEIAGGGRSLGECGNRDALSSYVDALLFYVGIVLCNALLFDGGPAYDKSSG